MKNPSSVAAAAATVVACAGVLSDKTSSVSSTAVLPALASSECSSSSSSWLAVRGGGPKEEDSKSSSKNAKDNKRRRRKKQNVSNQQNDEHDTSRSKSSSSSHDDTSHKDRTPSNPILEEILQEEDYYKILGLTKQQLNRESSQQQQRHLQKSYRRRCVQTHPDKTDGDRRAFDKVAEAYDVLSDESKRRLYDQFGKPGLDPTNPRRNADMRGAEDIFRSFFGGPPRSSSSSSSWQAPNPTMRYQMEVTLEDLYQGVTRTVWVVQPDGTHRQQVQVHVPKGSHHGQSIVLSGELHNDDSPPGDLIFMLSQRPHKLFQRKGHDLVLEMKITLEEALCGWTRTIRHLDGRHIQLGSAVQRRKQQQHEEEELVPIPIHTGQVQVLRGHGMPKRGHYSHLDEFGDLYIQFQVQLPQATSTHPLTTEEIQELKRLLHKLQGNTRSGGHHSLLEPHGDNTTQEVHRLQPALISDLGRASGPVEDEEDDPHHEDAHTRQKGFFYQHGFGGAFGSHAFGSSSFFGNHGFDEDDGNVQCTQM